LLISISKSQLVNVLIENPNAIPPNYNEKSDYKKWKIMKMSFLNVAMLLV
jgi:hypothetical protein